jgi:hypothetical protein
VHQTAPPATTALQLVDNAKPALTAFTLMHMSRLPPAATYPPPQVQLAVATCCLAVGELAAGQSCACMQAVSIQEHVNVSFPGLPQRGSTWLRPCLRACCPCCPQ